MPSTEFEKRLSAFKFLTCRIPFGRVCGPEVDLANLLMLNMRGCLCQHLVNDRACPACDSLDCRVGDHCTIGMPDNFVESNAHFIGCREVNARICFTIFKGPQYGWRVVKGPSRAVAIRCYCTRGCSAINRVGEGGGALMMGMTA